MTAPTGRSAKAITYPEHFAYRIDDHRYITIKGNSNCEGRIYYYDTRLGIRTSVATTGFSLGNGAFNGYYAIDSDYIAIPALEFSEISGGLLYIYYSRDQGRTFKYFLASGDGGRGAIVIAKGDALYVAQRSSVQEAGLVWAKAYDVSHQIAIDAFHNAVKPNGQFIDPRSVPLKIQSPSLSTRWTCGPPIDSK